MMKAISTLFRHSINSRDSAPAPQEADKETQKVILNWAKSYIAPWKAHKYTLNNVRDNFEEINSSNPISYIFEIRNGVVNYWEKPGEENIPENHVYASRKVAYRTFFQAVIDQWLPGLNTLICVSMCDGPISEADFPTFSHQRTTHNTILLPDIDFLLTNFYSEQKYKDHTQYDKKSKSAIFVGSTTGDIITSEIIKNKWLPRLNAAEHFNNHEFVDFSLPGLAQYENEHVRQELLSLPFCGGPHISWANQLNKLFLISIDGNGATCSRVVISLLSNSVLLKYDSPWTLYYFISLTPWIHYVPINSHEDVEKAVLLERQNPGFFRQVSECGNKFAQDYLCRSNVEFYMASLLALYERCFDPENGDAPNYTRPTGALGEMINP